MEGLEYLPGDSPMVHERGGVNEYVIHIADSLIAVNEGAEDVIHHGLEGDRKSTRLNSSHTVISYAVFCLKKKKKKTDIILREQMNSRKNYVSTTYSHFGAPPVNIRFTQHNLSKDNAIESANNGVNLCKVT